MSIGLSGQEIYEQLSQTSLSNEDRTIIGKLIASNNVAIRNTIEEYIKNQKDLKNEEK